jgi:hypothetical protein
MTLTLQRRAVQPWGTPGMLSIEGDPECFTLERTDVQIPAGRYRVLITFSPRFRRKLPLIDGVPGREGIRIHPANVQIELDGCVAVGLKQFATGVTRSREAMDRLQPQIAQALSRGEEVWIDVRG